MASPVKVKPEPASDDVFCVDTDSEAEEEDIDTDKLQPLAPKFALLSQYPVGCKVWYNLRCSPETKILHAKSAHVEEVSIHFENLRRVYKVKSEASEEQEQAMSFYEDQLVFAIGCPVKVTKIDTDEALDGVVVYLEREKGIGGRRQIRYAVQYSADNCITIEPGIATDRVKYRAGDCGIGADRKESNSSSVEQKQTTFTQGGDTYEEEKEAEVSSRSFSTESSAHSGHDNHNDCHLSSSIETTNPTLEPASPSQRKGGSCSAAQSLATVECNHSVSNQSESHDATNLGWEPPSSTQQNRSNESEPKVTHRPAKVAKREARSGEQDEVKVKGDASNGEAESTAAVRILTIPPWWKNQWGAENRRQLYSRLIGKTNFKSSTNCSIKISGNNPNEEMRITIESFCRDYKSKMNSIKHTNYIIERILVDYLADENSKMRLLFDLAGSDQSQLICCDNTCGVQLLHREIYDSHGSKSKQWWHLLELTHGQDLHPHDLSSLRLNLPKGSDCRIELFGRSVKVSRESPYVLVSGTKQLDVKNAVLMIEDAMQTRGKRKADEKSGESHGRGRKRRRG